MKLRSSAALLTILSAGAVASDVLTPKTEALSDLFLRNQGLTRAALVIQGGKAVGRRYASGYADRTRFISWSMAKSVTAVLVGELVTDGKLRLDAPVPFAEWQKPGDPRGKITLRQMLQMSSGLAHREGLDPADPDGAIASDTTSILFVSGTQGMAARGLAKPLEAAPGSKYEYSSITSLLLSELITRQLTDSKDPRVRAAAYKAFAEVRLFKPAGITSAFMEFDGAGTQIGGSIIYMTLDDWGRFGSLLLAGKGVDGAQVIAPEWLTFLITPSATDGGYGGHVWLNRPRTGPEGNADALFPGKGPANAYAAIGHLGQYVIVSPEQRLVVVRLGKTDDGKLGPVRAALGRLVAAVPMENDR